MSRKLVIFSVLSLLLFAFTFSAEVGRSIAESNRILLNGLASVGVSLGVAENQFNQLAQQYNERVEELEQREIELAQREAAFAAERERAIPLEWYVTALAFILLILVLLNFYLDWRRGTPQP